jgi:oligosaccharyltransferase complex subunit gamma
MEFPRPYDMVIYFTAPNCKLCEELQTEYKQVAQFYRDSGAMQAIRDEGNAKRAVFFAIVAYNDNNKQVFN